MFFRWLDMVSGSKYWITYEPPLMLPWRRSQNNWCKFTMQCSILLLPTKRTWFITPTDLESETCMKCFFDHVGDKLYLSTCLHLLSKDSIFCKASLSWSLKSVLVKSTSCKESVRGFYHHNSAMCKKVIIKHITKVTPNCSSLYFFWPSALFRRNT